MHLLAHHIWVCQWQIHIPSMPEYIHTLTCGTTVSTTCDHDSQVPLVPQDQCHAAAAGHA